MAQQQTVSNPVSLSGIGIHSGVSATLHIKPAPDDHGIVFAVAAENGKIQQLPAHIDHVRATELRTELCGPDGVSVATVEHFLAACYGLGVDNLLVEIDGPEVPILDGSAQLFCEALRDAGLTPQLAQRRILRVLKPVEVSSGGSFATLQPCEETVLTVSGEIDFSAAVIRQQTLSVILTEGAFEAELGYARTFGFASDLDALRARGLALGGSLDNAILVDGDRVVNPEGLRAPDEFIRHKLLDSIGDLALVGGSIAGHYQAVRPGHALNAALVRALLSEPGAWRWE